MKLESYEIFHLEKRRQRQYYIDKEEVIPMYR